MSDLWTIRMNRTGGYTILDEPGNVVGAYADGQIAAAHHANSLRDRIAMQKALANCLSLIEKGFEVRMQDQWPILKVPMQNCKNEIRSILFPEFRKISIEDA